MCRIKEMITQLQLVRGPPDHPGRLEEPFLQRIKNRRDILKIYVDYGDALTNIFHRMLDQDPNYVTDKPFVLEFEEAFDDKEDKINKSGRNRNFMKFILYHVNNMTTPVALDGIINDAMTHDKIEMEFANKVKAIIPRMRQYNADLEKEIRNLTQND